MNNPHSRTSNMNLIQGTWFNDELEYTFNETKVSFQFIISGNTYKGDFAIKCNKISLEYNRVGFEHILKWEAFIESVNENELVLIDISNQTGIKEVFIRKTEKTAFEGQTIEENEIRFIKELFLVILLAGLIIFSTITIIVGTFFEYTFSRKILLFITSDSISLEDKILQGGGVFATLGVLIMLVLNQIGSKTKSEILKKALDSKRSTQIYILIGMLLFAVVFWKVSTILLIGFAIVFVLVMMGVFINNRKMKL